jgi:uncharacterized membrane protein
MAMGLVTWVAVIAIVLVAIGLGVGIFFSGLIRGAEIVGNKIEENPTVKHAQNFVENRTGISQVDVLMVTTDKATYSAGDPVKSTVKNIGGKTLTFPDSALGLEIENVVSGQKYSVMSAQVITELNPGASKEIVWAEDAPTGDYKETVHTTSDQNVSAQASFKIR